MIFRPLLDLFEGWIDPFVRRSSYRPPKSTRSFLWHYVGQAKGAFAAMLAFASLVAVCVVLFLYTTPPTSIQSGGGGGNNELGSGF